MPLEPTLTDIIARLRQGRFPSSVILSASKAEQSVPILGRSRKALFPYRGSYKSDETPLLFTANLCHCWFVSAFSNDRLFTAAEPDADGDFKKNINPHSFEVVTAKCEPSVKDAKSELRYQFECLAYFALDPDSQPGKLVLNRTITLKDTWAKIEKRTG